MPPPAPTATIPSTTVIPPTAVAPTVVIPYAVVALVANPPIVDAPPINNNNAGGQLLNATRNVPVAEMSFEDMENYMVEKAKKESLELAQDFESK